MKQELTTMAIREKLMEYFKGSCVERMVASESVRVLTDDVSVRYMFERRERDLSNKRSIYLRNTRILILEMNPDTVTFSSNLYRSKQLREIRDSLELFLKEYLKEVTIKYPTIKTEGDRDDSALLEGTRLRTKDDVDMNMYQDFAREYGRSINFQFNPSETPF